MRKVLFIITQLFSILVEYTAIFFLCYLISKAYLISLIISLSLLLIGIIIGLISKRSLFNDTTSDDVEKINEEEFKELIDKVNYHYHRKIKLIYINYSNIGGIAFSAGVNVYLNNAYPVKKDYLKGVLGHELGHHISGVCYYAYLDSIKLSTIISKIFNLLMLKCIQKELKILPVVFFSLYVITSLNNLIFTYPFLYYDEYFANKYAYDIGCGEELRCYYAMCYHDERTKLEKLADFTHPNVVKMMDKLNKEMKIKKELLNFYYIHDELHYVKSDTLTLTIPSFIKVLKNNCLDSNELIKVRGEGIERIERRAFNHSKNIQYLIFPNLKECDYETISFLDLKSLNINSSPLLYSLIINDNQQKEYSVKGYKELKKKNYLDNLNISIEKD